MSLFNKGTSYANHQHALQWTDRFTCRGDYHATIVTVGAGLAELTFQGCHLVIPHKPEEMPLAHLGKVLIPWQTGSPTAVIAIRGRNISYPLMNMVQKPLFMGCSPA